MKTRRRVAKILVPTGLLLLLSACGPFESLAPLFTGDDLVVDPALAGAWLGDGEYPLNLRFRESANKAYSLIETGIDDDTHNAVQLKYEAHLVRLGDFLFLDVVPEEPQAWQTRQDLYKLKLLRSEHENRFEPDLLQLADLLYLQLVTSDAKDLETGADEYELPVLHAHWFFRVEIDGNVLRLAYIDGDWVKQLSDQAKSNLGYQDVGAGVLTASTQDLRDFVLDRAADDEAFSENLEWHRKE